MAGLEVHCLKISLIAAPKMDRSGGGERGSRDPIRRQHQAMPTLDDK